MSLQLGHFWVDVVSKTAVTHYTGQILPGRGCLYIYLATYYLD